MGEFIAPIDLEPFAEIEEAKAEAMIADAQAMATLVAPCIANEGFAHAAAVKAVLRGAILRWHDSGSGAVASQGAGPYAQTLDTRQTRKSLFWPSEIEQLQDMCTASGSGSAFAVDTVSTAGACVHADSCALNFGALYCSCGAVLTQGLPLYG